MKIRLRPLIMGVLGLSSLGLASAQQGSKLLTQLLPSDTKLAACYAQVFVPPDFETVETRELKREASERWDYIPAKYETVEEAVIVKEPFERLEVVPAIHEWVEEKVLVKPAHEEVAVVPPVFETVSEEIVDTPAHTVWQKGQGALQRLDHATGDIVCLSENPTTYKKITKRVLKNPGSTKTVQVPAEYITIKKRVVKTPATTRRVQVQGEYKIVKKQKLVSPAQTQRVSVPAEYHTIAKRIKVNNGHIEWQPVLCKTNVTPAIVRALQRGLQQADFNPGPIDGILGAQTMVAIGAYQRAKGLPVGSVTLETIESLGVPIDKSQVGTVPQSITQDRDA